MCSLHTTHPTQYECEDVLSDGTLLDTLGVGLGRAEMYAAMLAVKKLGEDTTRNVATVRFFGKFFGLYSDYYVFETTLKDAPEIPEAPGTKYAEGESVGILARGARHAIWVMRVTGMMRLISPGNSYMRMG